MKIKMRIKPLPSLLQTKKSLIIALELASIMLAGIAIGWVGEWGLGESPTTRNSVALALWLSLLSLLVLSRTFELSHSSQIASSALLLGFIFLMFLLYRHQQFGNLGDSRMYLGIATYNYHFGVADQFHISSALSADLNQALFDLGFSRLWIVPLLCGIAFAALLFLIPKIFSQYSYSSFVYLIGKITLLLSSSSCLLFFFRTYMEFYTFPSILICVGLLITFAGIRKKQSGFLFIGSLVLSFAPLFHLIYGLPVVIIVIWGLIVLSDDQKCQLRVSWVLGALIPIVIFSGALLLNRDKLFSGNIAWFASEGFFRNNLLDLNAIQLLLLVCFVSFPLIFILLYQWLRGNSVQVDKQKSLLLKPLALCLTLAWVTFVLLTNFGLTLQRDRDLIIALLMPVIYVTAAILLYRKGEFRKRQDVTLFFSSVVTATVVTSFIEPAWY